VNFNSWNFLRGRVCDAIVVSRKRNESRNHLRLPRQAPDGAATRVQLKQKAAASFSLPFFLSFPFFSCSFSMIKNDK
jgi:hypothetical protein